MAPDGKQSSPTRPFAVDHQRLVRSREYLEIVADTVSALGAGVHQLRVDHESDGRCCRQESWPATAERLLAAMAQRRDRSVAHVHLGDPS